MTSAHQTSLDDFNFKQKRRQRTDKASPGDVPLSDDTQRDVDVAAEEIKFLKAFDLDYTYGPAIGGLTNYTVYLRLTWVHVVYVEI